VPMERRFQMPFPLPGDQWYSFDHGPVHFIQTSTEQPFGAGSSQWQFVVNDLMTVDRQLTPWVVVTFSPPSANFSFKDGQVRAVIWCVRLIHGCFCPQENPADEEILRAFLRGLASFRPLLTPRPPPPR